MNTTDYNNIWQQSAPPVAWGTVALFIAIITGYPLVIWAAATDILGYPVASLLCTVLCYACFTVMHDAGHGGIIQSGSKLKVLESLMGWASSVPLLLGSFTFFKHMHDRHHAFTNDPDRDPDHMAFSGSWLAVIASIYYMPIQYYIRFMTVYKNDPEIKAAFKSTVIYLIVVYGALVLLATNGLAVEVLCFAVLPMLITLFLLVLFFDYLPHHPHKTLGAYHNTRVYPSRLLNWLLFGQNYHLAHHLYPRVPWYKYRELYHNLEPMLREQNSPIEDLSQGEFLQAGNNSAKTHHHVLLTVSDIEQLTEEAVSISFAIPDKLKLNFLPGQYITVSKLIGTEFITRCYSICSPPNDKLLTIAVKQTDKGLFSRYLNQQLKVGDQLIVQGPFGEFSYGDDSAEQLVLIAAGSGITPIMAIVEAALTALNKPQVHLIYACRNKANIMFYQRLIHLQHCHSERLTIDFVLSQNDTPGFGIVGRLDDAVLKSLLPNHPEKSEYFLCGHAAFSQAVVKTLLELNIQTEQIHQEQFTIAAQLPEGPEHAITMRLNGQTQTFKAAQNQTILTAALQQGVSIPHACGQGGCGSCKVKIMKGEVLLDEQSSADKGIAGLTEQEMAAGYTLSCQAKPLSPLVIENAR